MKKAKEDFLVFFEDLYLELGKFGRIDALHVCDNLGDHMIGHVYVKFTDEEQASDALNIMNGRYYDGRKMEVEFSPVTDFREARCRDFDEDTCSRGGFCNFMHVKPVPMCLIASLAEDCDIERRKEEDERREKERRERDRKREKKRRHRDRDRDSRERDRGRDKDRDRESRRRKRRHRDGEDDQEQSDGDRSRSPPSKRRDRKKRSYSRSRSRSHSRSRDRSASPSKVCIKVEERR